MNDNKEFMLTAYAYACLNYSQNNISSVHLPVYLPLYVKGLVSDDYVNSDYVLRRELKDDAVTVITTSDCTKEIRDIYNSDDTFAKCFNSAVYDILLSGDL